MAGPLDPLLLNAGDAGGDLLDLALLASVFPDNRTAALLMLDFLTEPDSNGGFGALGRVWARGSTHYLPEAWQTVFAPHLGEVADEVLAIAERHMRRARSLHLLSGRSAAGWDPWTIYRSSISAKPDHILDAFDVLIDAARDSLAHLMAHDSKTALARCNSWAASGVPLLKRLALHTITHAAVIDANARINWLRQSPEWLFDPMLRQEVAGLVEALGPDAGAPNLDGLVADLRTGAPDLDQETLARFQLPILGAICRGHPEHPATNKAIAELTEQHPHLAPMINEPVGPAVTVTTGFVADELPTSAGEFHDALADDTTTALTTVYQYRDAHSPWHGPTWSGAIQLITATVGEHPADGFRLLDHDNEHNLDVTAAVIRGWAKAPLDDATATGVIDRLRHLDLTAHADDISRLLESGGTERNPTQWSKYDAAQMLATETWRSLPNEDPTDAAPFDDWLGRAINRSSGRLAQFWLEVVAYDWRQAGDKWSGLPPATRDILCDLLAGSTINQKLAEVVLASQLHFLHSADPAWCEATLLPHFLWTDLDRPTRDWQAYLSVGRFNDRLLNAGLLAGYLDAAANAERFTGGLRRQLADHLASVAVFSEIDSTSWLAEFTRRAVPADRVQWIDHVSWLLGRLEADAVEAQWARWVQAFRSGRLDNTPNILT